MPGIVSNLAEDARPQRVLPLGLKRAAQRAGFRVTDDCRTAAPFTNFVMEMPLR
jgi:hypothetical protein